MAVIKTAFALVNKAIKTSDVYCATAVYSIASDEQCKILEEIMFNKRRNALMLARWEHTPALVLKALSVKNDSAIKVRLNKNPNTPAQALSELYLQDENSSKRNTYVTVLIAQHQHTPANVLENISYCTDTDSLMALSKNPAVNVRILNSLVNRQPHDVLYKVFDKNVVANPSASSDLLALIYARGDDFVRAAVIAHSHCPPFLLEQDAKDVELAIQRQLATRSINHKLLTRLANSLDIAVRCGVAGNIAANVTLVNELINDDAVRVRRVIAMRGDLKLNNIKLLMNDTDHWVKLWLGRNHVTPRKILATLAADCHADVRRAVARNPRCPIALLVALANDASAWVRSAVAYQKNAPVRLLLGLAQDLEIDVLSGVAANPHTPQPILQKLAASADDNVRRGVILNRKAKRMTLLPLLHDPYYLHRLLLITNQQLKDKDKWPLCEDPDANVRFTAFSWFAMKYKSVV